ncbi:alanine racemase [Sphingobium phenoxybenzoativorans]|uniref:alanine racemase n=1 Tax=Sphingobium phenoxybenzoativorans TaxID=1592790 RepID=A0A975K2W9_9SPHN|nr:alanine racemase [Sphingobium phenoxybenzoativorans]QUT03930.1 alanine racemase [Sphingobium phenoxybenzoativorans]
MSSSSAAPLRLRLDREALVSNWRWLRAVGGDAACGAAIKANGYGLGSRQVMAHLAAAGCRDFFVATWAEAEALMPLPEGVSLSVLHGVRAEDMPAALSGVARPVLNTPEQVARWRKAGGGACDVMIDTGINRLGLDWRQDCAALTEGLTIHTLMSHLACADEDHALNAQQRDRFADVAQKVKAGRLSLSNSAGILLGESYRFGLTRPGLALYGGMPRAEAESGIRQVVFPQAQILQRRKIRAGDTAGYSATFTATQDVEAAILNLGYADGYLRGFSGRGAALVEGVRLPVLGRVSMDLLIIDVSAQPDLAEGDWVDIEYDLRIASAQSGLSHYELLTGLGARYDRIWA